MKNLAFVIWMLGWPYLYHLSTKDEDEDKYDKTTRGVAAAFNLALWLIVGAMLFER